MRRRPFLVLTATLLSLAACSGEGITGLDQELYNGTFSGPATFSISSPSTGIGAASGETVKLTLSQLGRDFTGTFAVTDSSGQSLYAGTVAGRTTSTGADFTFVIPPTCPGVMYGSFTVSNGDLTGSAAGRDCNAGAPGNNVHITFTNLARQ